MSTNGELLTFVLANRDNSWDWLALSKNPNISVREIINSPELPWAWFHVSGNPNIRIQDVVDNLDKDWRWDQLSWNPGFSIVDVLSTPQLPWDWRGVSLNPEITFADVLAHPECPWNYNYLSRNQYAPERATFQELCAIGLDKNWNWFFLSRKLRVTISDILKIGERWDWNTGSVNPYIPIADVIANRHLFLSLGGVSWNKKLTFGVVQTIGLDDPGWWWMDLSMNPGIKFEDIVANPELPWVTSCVSMNTSVSIDHVVANPTFTWEYRYLSANDGIKFEDVIANPTLPWDWPEICRTKRAKFSDFIHRLNHDQIAWQSLSGNWFMWKRVVFNLQNELRQVCIELESMPAGRHRALPAGGVDFHRQMERFEELQRELKI